MKQVIRRVIHPEVRVVDGKKGLVEYVASDESLDSYREVVRADGWRFDHFRKNAPLVDSHDYSTIEHLVGKVVDFAVRGKKLIETAQWAIDVADNKLAQLGWKMTEAGYLRAVSVGFWPVKMVSRWDANPQAYNQQVADLGAKMDDANCPRVIYLEQQQIELSVCIIGANPNALAKAYKAGVVSDSDVEFIGEEHTKRMQTRAADVAADVARVPSQRQREEFLVRFGRAVESLNG
jgi:hypothetical protein